MLRLDAADAATFDDVAVAEAERFAAADAVLRTKLLSMLAYMFECRARYCCKYQTNEAIAKVNNKVVLVLVHYGMDSHQHGVVFRVRFGNKKNTDLL